MIYERRDETVLFMAPDRGQVCLLFSFTVMPGLGPGYFILKKLVTVITAHYPVFGTIFRTFNTLLPNTT